MRITDLLTELRMSPSSLKTQAAAIDALVGMEFEIYVPGAGEYDPADLEMVEDMDYDTRPYDIDDILKFYANGDNAMSKYELDRLQARLQEEYDEYITEEIDSMWNSDGYDYFQENFDKDNLDEDETVDDVWNDQGREYWAIHSQFVDEQREDPPSERDWLRERSWTSMEDVNSHFGFTWPYWKQEDPPDSMSMQEVADSFAQHVGRDVSVEGNGSNGEYGLTTDGSLNSPRDSNDGGLEFISPPLSVSEMITDLELVRGWAEKNGAYTDDDTGLHINVSIQNADWTKLDYVKLAIILGDQYILEKFGRAENTYAVSAFEKIEKIIRTSPDTAFHMMATMKQHMNEFASRILHDLATAKYTSINLKLNFDPGKQRVEFRSPGGDYLGKNFNLIKDTMLRFVVALDSALDPAKDRKEYITKLYKMLSPSVVPGSGFDITRYFADFSAGEMSKEELKSALHLFRPKAATMRPQLPTEPEAKKAPAGSMPQSMKKSPQSATQLNTYIHNVANNIANAPADDRVGLIRELVTVMADRSGYPEWANSVATAKQVIQRSGVDPTVIASAVRAVTSGSRMTRVA